MPTRSEARVVAVLRPFASGNGPLTLVLVACTLATRGWPVRQPCMAVAGAALAASALASVAASAVSVDNNRTTLYDLTAVALDGSRVSLASLRGNVSLVINVATF